MLNDLILISKIKEGDIKAYEGLFRLYYEPLCRYAVSYVHRMEIAEEIVQDLFYIFWKERDKLPVFSVGKSLSLRSRTKQVAAIYRALVYQGKIQRRKVER